MLLLRRNRRNAGSYNMHLDYEKRVCSDCGFKMRVTRMEGRLFCKNCWAYSKPKKPEAVRLKHLKKLCESCERELSRSNYKNDYFCGHCGKRYKKVEIWFYQNFCPVHGVVVDYENRNVAYCPECEEVK